MPAMEKRILILNMQNSLPVNWKEELKKFHIYVGGRLDSTSVVFEFEVLAPIEKPKNLPCFVQDIKEHKLPMHNVLKDSSPPFLFLDSEKEAKDLAEEFPNTFQHQVDAIVSLPLQLTQEEKATIEGLTPWGQFARCENGCTPMRN